MFTGVMVTASAFGLIVVVVPYMYLLFGMCICVCSIYSKGRANFVNYYNKRSRDIALNTITYIIVGK